MTATIDETHDPALDCWVATAAGHPDFPVQNLPLGIFAPPGAGPRIGSAIGDYILDLSALADLLPSELRPALAEPTLNALLALAPEARRALRRSLSALLCAPARRAEIEPHLHRAVACAVEMPARVGDYTDFYVGIHHATNVGKLFRPDNPLLPNYKYVPIGYHGRASSLRPSGVDVRRPNGQRKAPDSDRPDFGATRRLDYELELGVWIAGSNALGQPIPIAEAPRHIAGLCLLNDWSARDLQAWEYQPLGPFLAKNFHSTVSPWIVTVDALAPYRMAQPPRPAGDPQPLPYLLDATDQEQGALAIELSVSIRTARMRQAGEQAVELSRGPASSMYWTIAQIVAHHASNGCDLQPGDMLGTGTISGPLRKAFGSLLELSEGGAHPVTLPNGETRAFLADGDEISFAARATMPGYVPIGFGACSAVILPAVEP